jgi:S1-C subfamily serine protease
MRSPSRTIAASTLAAALAAVPPAGADARGRDLSQLLDRVAPSIASVKIVLKTEFNMGESTQDQESTLEARGAVVGERGLIMLWNSQLSASRLMEAVTRMGDEGGGFKLKMTPTDFKVTLPGDPTEHPAFLAAADSDLDLAFLQLETPPAAKLPAISFEGGRSLQNGDEVAGVSRMSPGFDRTPFVTSLRIRGRIEKPRRAWIVAASSELLGLPLFDSSGAAVGAVVTVFSNSSDASSQGGDILSLFALGGGRMETGPLGVFLLPSERIVGLVREAQKRADALLAERAADAAATPADPAASEN